jgi:hypothetical protein
MENPQKTKDMSIAAMVNFGADVSGSFAPEWPFYSYLYFILS